MNHNVMWSPGMSLEALEQVVILKAYKFYQGNKTATANSLGIAIRTLDTKLEKYEMSAIEGAAADEQRERDRVDQLRRARGVHNRQYDTSATPRTETWVDSKVEQGLRLQSTYQDTAQQQVSLPEREEVQSVLPKGVAASGSGKRR